MNSIADITNNWATQRGIAAYFTSETGSTNNDAKEHALAETAPVRLYVTSHQSEGRGRGQNHWLDTGSGDSLLSTWSFAVMSSPQPVCAPRIGLALFRAVSAAWPSLPWSLKAPNDLYLGGKKVAGLLVEAVSSGPRVRLLIGLGFNVLNHPRRFDQATHLSTSLSDGPQEGDWYSFLDELLSQFRDALPECLETRLTPQVCGALVTALNANPARPGVLQEVTPEGDLVYTDGRKRWEDL